MKKIISVFISICIMMSLCINAFASKQVVKEDDEINLPTSFVSSVKDDVALV